jgi:hypothetical protein
MLAGSTPDAINTFSRTMALWLTQLLTEMTIRGIPDDYGPLETKADNLSVRRLSIFSFAYPQM